MPFKKSCPGDFTVYILLTTILACLTPRALADNLLEDVVPVPYYYPPSKSSEFPYSDFSTVPPSASLYVYPTSTTPSPAWSPPPSGLPYSYGTAPLSSWMPANNTAPYPTGGWTHKVTPTKPETAPLVTQTSAVTVPAPPPPSTPAPEPSVEQNSATSRTASLAGLVLAAGIAMFAL